MMSELVATAAILVVTAVLYVVASVMDLMNGDRSTYKVVYVAGAVLWVVGQGMFLATTLQDYKKNRREDPMT